MTPGFVGAKGFFEEKASEVQLLTKPSWSLHTVTHTIEGEKMMKTMSLIGKIFLAFVLTVWGSTAFAIERIPKESGSSGFVNIGGAYLDVKSNMVAGNSLADISEDSISSILDSPDSESDVIPLFSFEFRWTFADTRTQIYVGNLLEDFLRFDMSTSAGVRQEMADSSIVGASFVFSTLPTEVWEDPYVAVANQPRRETDRSSQGLRLTWAKILATDFEMQYTWRKIDIDDELSGTGLGLTPAQIALLDREGNHHKAELFYTWKFDGDKQYFVPGFEYHKFDLDGDAMANDRYGVQFTYGYNGDQFSVVANAMYAAADYDSRNPIYNKEQEDDIYGGTLTGFWHRPFGTPEEWNLVASGGFYEVESDIDFYDSEVSLFSLSVLYRFK
jgi:hypothetical protein